MEKKLFLLDGMALVYRAHFALAARPIFTSKGENTSALYGFTQTLLEILRNQKPTHIGVAFDTEGPTQRHKDYAEYKATRQAMPEDLSKALPNVVRMLDAFRIPVLTCEGYEADDLIGTLVRRAEREGFTSYMVTPDKDFGQLVGERTFQYKPGRMGDSVEVMGIAEIRKRWGVERPEQVVDVLALMGDASDNIPGVPAIGEKTAIKLISQFGTVENLLAHRSELSGRIKETLEKNGELATLSKQLALLMCDAPCPTDLETLRLREWDEAKLKQLFVEFEFNSIGKRLFGEDFKAGRGFVQEESTPGPASAGARKQPETREQLVLIGESEIETGAESSIRSSNSLRKLADVKSQYEIARDASELESLIGALKQKSLFAVHALTSAPDPKHARILGLAFATHVGRATYVPLAQASHDDFVVPPGVVEALSSQATKVGHDLKSTLAALKWHGIEVNGALFDTMVAHSLIEPEMRHGLEYLSEMLLGYTPIVVSPSGTAKVAELAGLPLKQLADIACEKADLALQLKTKLEPELKSKDQERVFFDIEAPLIPVLVRMEHAGVKVDAASLADFAAQLSKEMDLQEKTICKLAGTVFNLNSPRQLGQILFDVMRICEAPKKTRTGQYATDEQTLLSLAGEHEVVKRLLDYRNAAKLKSTYADALPASIWAATGRVHTTYNQVVTSTGRLNSQNPNLQNIPIRTEKGQEIRKAFVPGLPGYSLLSADYSQIELRIIAALSHEPGLLEAFRTGVDVHTATAAKVYGVSLEGVTPEMRRKAKMVNYGIAYGISAFGLAQRLSIPRKEAAEIIDQYFKQFPGIARYMEETVAFAREHGYVETVTGRRRYMRDIRSSNNTVRSAAERNAINAPIQGTAADMIKLAMIRIDAEFQRRQLKSRMLLQVHDELVFELHQSEQSEVMQLVAEQMKNAISLDAPIEVEMGVGANWLEAH